MKLRYGISILVLFLCGVRGFLPSVAAQEGPSVPDATRPRPAQFHHPVLIEFHGEINELQKLYFTNRLERARRAGADLLIIEIDSPGGEKFASLKMARMLRDCKWAYTVALITHEAISGGALVSLGVDEIFIDPNAKFGDIGEIQQDLETGVWRLIEPKIESYLSRDARDLAESKGRSPDLAEAMIDKDVLVYFRADEEEAKNKAKDEAKGAAKDEVERKAEKAAKANTKAPQKFLFKTVRADDPNPPQAPWRLIEESGRERFLTLSGQRALELGIAQHAASGREDVARELGCDPAALRVYRRTSTDTIVYILNRPLITGLLVVIGLVALYFELSAPGIGVGGLIAGLAAVLFFWSRFLGGTAGWLEVVLFGAGIVFLLMEMFVIPGFGVAGISGIALLFASVLLASQEFVFPQTAHQWDRTLTSSLTLLISGFLFAILAAILSRHLGSLPLFNRIILDPGRVSSDGSVSTQSKGGKPLPPLHPEISIGDLGKTESLLRPAGRARFAERSFDVISDGAYVEPGTPVRVIRINGNIITVTPVDESE